jgi:glycosyltransferase involved in cell wall biosynthesis
MGLESVCSDPMTTSTPAPRHALVFFPYLPYPVRDGAQKRCVAMLRALQVLGYDVTMLVSTLVADVASMDDVRDAARALGITIHVHRTGDDDGDDDGRFLAGLSQVPVTPWEHHTPPSLYGVFRTLALTLTPDVVLVNYGYWHMLVRGLELAGTVRMVDMIDLASLHAEMTASVRPMLPPSPVDPRRVPDEALQEDFFRRRQLHAGSHEFAAFDAFDGTIAISPLEAELVQQRTARTSVSYVPMATPIPECRNTYDGPPVYVMSGTPLNQQGYAYFAQRVLPRVRAKAPGFSLRVVGSGAASIREVEGVELVGRVDSLVDVYASGRFAVCPLLGGTGQQTKVIEAMAHGLAVVALDDLADRSPIVHDVNGLRARDAVAFAEACLRLWNDPSLARRLGDAARETIRAGFDADDMPRQLACALERARETSRQRGPRLEEPTLVRSFLGRAPADSWGLERRRVAIYGAGAAGRQCRAHLASSAHVIAFIDSDRRKDGTAIDDLPIVSPERLGDLNVDVVVVASIHWPQILNQLDKCGWDGARVRVF